MRSMTEITVVDTEDSSLISSCRWISYIDVDVSGDHVIAGSLDRRMVWFDSKYIMPGSLFHVSQSTLTASYKRTASYISNLIVFASPTSPFRPILPRKITTTRRFPPPISSNGKLVRRRMHKRFSHVSYSDLNVVKCGVVAGFYLVLDGQVVITHQ